MFQRVGPAQSDLKRSAPDSVPRTATRDETSTDFCRGWRWLPIACACVASVSTKSGLDVPIELNVERTSSIQALRAAEPVPWYDTEFDMTSIKDFDAWMHFRTTSECNFEHSFTCHLEIVVDFGSSTWLAHACWRRQHGVSSCTSHGRSFCDSSRWVLSQRWSSLETLQSHVWTSPRMASVAASLGFEHLKSDSNLYFQPEQRCYMLRYVDDLLIFGDKKTTDFLFSELQKQLCLRSEGVLEPGTSISFLGRCITRREDSIEMSMSTSYMTKCVSNLTCWNVGMRLLQALMHFVSWSILKNFFLPKITSCIVGL